MTMIELTSDDALVLFDFLAREIDGRKGAKLVGAIEHPAEYWALNGLLGHLEKDLVEPFKSDYRELVDGARERRIEQSDPERTFVIGSSGE